MTTLYPFLSGNVQKRVLAALESDWDAGRAPSTLRLDGQFAGREFPSWGGTPVQASELSCLRGRVLEAAALGESAETSTAGQREVDRRVGRALLERLGEDPSALFSSGTWAFFAMILLPDVVFARFGDSKRFPRARFIDGRRNALATLYLRELVMPTSGPSSGEDDDDLLADELVGLLDRSLAADRRLLKSLVDRRQPRDPSVNRRVFFRELLREATFEKTVTMTALLDDADLDRLADHLVERVVDRLDR